LYVLYIVFIYDDRKFKVAPPPVDFDRIDLSID